jgi:predicted porin
VGTFQDAEGALNIATNLTDNLHIGAQVYARDIGRLGAGKPQLDWAYADYKVRDWLGFRGGKVKTPLGLYNDTQDMEFLHPWVLLPQSTYPTALRSLTIAHTGGDIYGTIGLGRAGSVSYQAYGGTQPVDMQGGYLYVLQNLGYKNVTYSGIEAGYDVRWKTPIKGFLAGMSYMWADNPLGANVPVAPGVFLPATGNYKPQQYAGYGEYRRKGWTLAAEFRPLSAFTTSAIAGRAMPNRNAETTDYYVSVAYRFTKWLELGTYNSRYQYNATAVPLLGLAANDTHVDDQAVTVRFDPMKHWDFKIEEHFMNGVGSVAGLSEFYPSDNPQGLKPNTKLLAIRLGFSL